MGANPPLALLLDTASSLQRFVSVFIGIYVLLILIYILLSWIRVPYSRTFSVVQNFLAEVVSPYLRIFRRVIPAFGPLDLSPIVAVAVLLIVRELVNYVIGALL